MENNETQDQASRVWGDEKKGQRSFDPNRNPRTGRTSTAIRYQPQRIDRKSREAADANARREQDCLGGILRQLEELEQEYIEYIESHENRLKKRLAEDEEKKKQAKTRIHLLRDSIIAQLKEDSAEPDD